MDENIPRHLQEIGDGKYQYLKWCELPFDYLIKYYEEDEDQLAYLEIKRRKYATIDEQYLDFGEHKGKKWIEVDSSYLNWIAKNIEDKKELVQKAIKYKENKYKTTDIQERLISFGKFKDKKWIELKDSYLKWLMLEYPLDSAKYKMAKEVYEYKKNNLKTYNFDIEIFDEKRGFGQYKNKKWMELEESYLKWIVSEFGSEQIEYVYAKKVLECKIRK
ncbi:MAG: hypothetical protein C0626_13625 [Arcobacter sp.]|nr:MAG: hypothetical protein C0626_13625 [Arcobacter sp.]